MSQIPALLKYLIAEYDYQEALPLSITKKTSRFCINKTGICNSKYYN